jgi:hypothetical protein
VRERKESKKELISFSRESFDLKYRVGCGSVAMYVPIAQIKNTTWTKDVYEPSDVSARQRCDQSRAGILTVTPHHFTFAG